MQVHFNKLLPLAMMCFALSSVGYCEEAAKDNKPKKPTKEELFSEASISKISEMYGHLIFKGLDNPVLKLNFDAVLKGLQDAKAGKAAPLKEQEFEEMMGMLQEYAYQDLANKNLKDAENFLKENSKKEGVKILEPEKLQYQILQEGKGQTVTEDMQLVIKYNGKYLDGTTFGSSDQTGGNITMMLKNSIPGFRKAVIGMKVGEKRKIFIHPTLGYGTSGQLLPNSLLIFEVEVVDAKIPPKEPEKKEAGKTEQKPQDSSIAAEPLFPDPMEEEADGDDSDDEEVPVIPKEEQKAAPAKEAPKPASTPTTTAKK
jgi:peptidylprolyl isomerase